MGIRSAVIAVSVCGPMLTGGAAIAQSLVGNPGRTTSTTVVTPPSASKSSPKEQATIEPPSVPGVVIVTRPPVRREVEVKQHRVTKRNQKKEVVAPPASAAAPTPAPAAAGTSAGTTAGSQPNAAQAAAPAPGNPQKVWPLVTGAGAAAGGQASGQQPAPDLWSEAEIKQAKTYCEGVLKGIDAVMTAEDPIKEGECGSPVVYRVSSVGKGPAVEISPPVVLTCDMVATLDKWIKREVQPQARALVGGPVVKIETMSSYSCRNAYGRTKTRLSEHAKANAIDIGGFVTGKDAVHVLAAWGPTERELKAIAAKREAERAAAAAAAAAQSSAKATSSNLPQPVQQSPQPNVGSRAGVPGVAVPGSNAQPSFGLAPTRLGGPAPKDGKHTVLPAPPTAPKANDPKSQFLRNIHTSACRYFGTVLGPEANNAHKNHFHLDMAQRNRGNFCE